MADGEWVDIEDNSNGWVDVEPKQKFEFKPSFGQRFGESALQALAGLYEGTRFMPPVRFAGKMTGAEELLPKIEPKGTIQGVSRGVGNIAPFLLGVAPFLKGAQAIPYLAARPALAGAS